MYTASRLDQGKTVSHEPSPRGVLLLQSKRQQHTKALQNFAGKELVMTYRF